MSMPQWPHAVFETYVCCKLCTMYMESDSCMWLGMRLQYIACLSIFQKPRKPPRYATGSSFASEICSGSNLWEVVQIFQRESIFCGKISPGGSLFIEKLVPGGTNFGRSIFIMTDPVTNSLGLSASRIPGGVPSSHRQ